MGKKAEKPKTGEIVDGVPSNPPVSSIGFTKEDRTTIGNGLVSLNTALFQHASREALRIEKIRGIVEHIEDKVLDENVIDNLPPLEQVRIMESLRRSMDNSILFLERLQRGSLQLITIMQIYDELNAKNGDTGETTVAPVANKQAVASLKGELIDLISRKKNK